MVGDEESSTTELLRVVVLRDGTEATVIVVGHLGASSSGRFRDRVEELLATRPGSIAIDASGVTFADSSGLAALLRARHAVTTGAGRGFRIIDPSPALRHVAELTGFQTLLLED
jgi:anti-sigma B factor antagonist